MRILYDLITTDAAQALGIEGHRLEMGNPANLVVLNAASVWEALWTNEAPCHVIKGWKEDHHRK